MVRWLHISDLHIKDKADWNNFQKELIKKCNKIGKIDLVIVTGDFHNFSDKGDFHLAKNFLQKLIANLGLDINKDLFLIPGNHDGVTVIEKKNLYISAARGNPLNLEKECLDHLLNMFADYEKFVRELIPDYPAEHPAQIHNRLWNGQINFIHCNTAISADGNDKNNQLMDIDSLTMADYKPDKPNVILAHNSFYDLNEKQQQRVKDVIRSNPICAYLCGDRHIDEVKQITYEDNQNRQIPCVVSYKSAPEAMDSYSIFGMIIGEWENGIASLRGWTWSSGNGFIMDHAITEKEIDMTGRIEVQELEALEDQEFNSKKEDAILSSQRGCVKVELELDDKKKQQVYGQKKDFIKMYYNMTPHQLDLFNRKFKTDIETRLKIDSSPEQLCSYVETVEKRCCLEKMVEYMRTLF